MFCTLLNIYNLTYLVIIVIVALIAQFISSIRAAWVNVS